MGKLLNLARFCINDEKFYDNNTNSPKIMHIFNEKDCTLMNIAMSKLTPENSGDYTEYYSILRLVWDKYRPTETLINNDKTVKGLFIEFNDEPPIQVSRNCVVLKQESVEGSVVYTKKYLKYFKTKQNYSYEAVLSTYGFEYVIKCGTVSEKISEKEYTTLIAEYEIQKDFFKSKSDLYKIDERLKQYTSKS
jgi:hypothetical protein